MGAIDYREQFAPVVLIVGNKWAEPLIDVFVHDFRLTVGFLVVRGGKLDSNAYNTAEFFLE